MSRAGTTDRPGGEVSYRPAPLASELSYRLADARLSSGEGWSVDLATLTDAAFVNRKFGDSRMIRLDLHSTDGRRSLGYNGSETGWQDDPDARAFLGLVRDTLDAIAAARPDAEVALGDIGRPRYGMFAVGLASAALGAGIFAAALATGVSGERLVAAGLPMLLLLVVGGVVMRGWWPWARPARGKASAVARVIDDILARTAS